MDGVTRGLNAPKPAHRDPVLLSDEDKIACAIRPLPATQLEALLALERDSVLTSGLGELMTRAYLATRRAENALATLKGDEWARLETFSTF